MTDRNEHIRLAIAMMRKRANDILTAASDAEIEMGNGRTHVACSHLVCAGFYGDGVRLAARYATKKEGDLLAKASEEATKWAAAR